MHASVCHILLRHRTNLCKDTTVSSQTEIKAINGATLVYLCMICIQLSLRKSAMAKQSQSYMNTYTYSLHFEVNSGENARKYTSILTVMHYYSLQHTKSSSKQAVARTPAMKSSHLLLSAKVIKSQNRKTRSSRHKSKSAHSMKSTISTFESTTLTS